MLRNYYMSNLLLIALETMRLLVQIIQIRHLLMLRCFCCSYYDLFLLVLFYYRPITLLLVSHYLSLSLVWWYSASAQKTGFKSDRIMFCFTVSL